MTSLLISRSSENIWRYPSTAASTPGAGLAVCVWRQFSSRCGDLSGSSRHCSISLSFASWLETESAPLTDGIVARIITKCGDHRNRFARPDHLCNDDVCKLLNSRAKMRFGLVRSPAAVVLDDDIQCPKPVSPSDLFAFFVCAAVVRNSYFENSASALGYLRNYLWLDTETVLLN